MLPVLSRLLRSSRVLIFVSTLSLSPIFFFFFFNDTATTEIYTLSLHDALPISLHRPPTDARPLWHGHAAGYPWPVTGCATRSEEHTSELQSRLHLVCRLLLEKKKKHSLAM